MAAQGRNRMSPRSNDRGGMLRFSSDEGLLPVKRAAFHSRVDRYMPQVTAIQHNRGV